MNLPVLLSLAAAVFGAEPVFLERVELNEVRRLQEGGFTARDAGSLRVEISGSLGPEAVVWAKLRQGGRTAARALPALASPVEEAFPGGRLRLSAANGVLRAESADGASEVPVMGLLDLLHQAGRKVRFEPVEYAVLSEDGATVPTSLCLLRRDREGNYWVVSKRPEELDRILYFLAVDGIMFGMRLEGSSLAFYSKPVPRLPKAVLPLEERRPSL